MRMSSTVKTLGKWGTGVWMAGCILLAFLWAPEAARPDFSTTPPTMIPWPEFRIFFFHVPAAWIAVLAFFVAMVASIRFLRRPRRELDDLAMASSQLGFLFCFLALVSGMIWARHEWGAFWNWDPRQNTVLVLLLIYAGYFTLRSAIPEPERRARLSAVYSIVAFVTVPFLVFIVPRILETLHPSPIIPTGENRGTMDGRMRTVFFMFLAGYTAVYVWLLDVQAKLERALRLGAKKASIP